jgi:hypothetical protein
MEDFAISRLHRESLVTAIWEGASNIQALDMLEAMHKKHAHESLLEDLIPMLERAGTPEASLAKELLEKNVARLAALAPQEAQWYSKDLLTLFADAAQVALLYSLAERAGERYSKLASLYAERFLACRPYPDWAMNDRQVWMLA